MRIGAYRRLCRFGEIKVGKLFYEIDSSRDPRNLMLGNIRLYSIYRSTGNKLSFKFTRLQETNECILGLCYKISIAGHG